MIRIPVHPHGFPELVSWLTWSEVVGAAPRLEAGGRLPAAGAAVVLEHFKTGAELWEPEGASLDGGELAAVGPLSGSGAFLARLTELASATEVTPVWGRGEGLT